jgi:ribosomal-protein-alanine N-acetyltransferase
MDGNVFSKEWCEERIRDSQRSIEGGGVGLWLAYELHSEEPVGFCGFLEFQTLHPDPQLVYALRERFTGKGYATEMARAAIAQAREQSGFDRIIASVDQVNAASLHILEKLGFDRVSTHQGSFGEIFILELRR